MDTVLLRDAARAAVECEAETGVPAELTVAQWALESGWGFHAPGNNCFGIKGHPSTGKVQLLSTTEWFDSPGKADLWVAARPGRIAVLIDGVEPDKKGRHKYQCKDWFAVYDSLADCFKAHSVIFTSGSCRNWLGTYLINRDLYAFISGIGPVYATDPDYADKVLALVAKTEVSEAIALARLTHA